MIARRVFFAALLVAFCTRGGAQTAPSPLPIPVTSPDLNPADTPNSAPSADPNGAPPANPNPIPTASPNPIPSANLNPNPVADPNPGDVANPSPNANPVAPKPPGAGPTATEEDEADRLSDRAAAAFKQGKYSEAEKLFRSALTRRETAYGDENLRTAAAVGNLAVCLHQTGQTAKADPLFERALAIRQKALGPAHPEVVATLDSMAGYAVDRGDYDKALKIGSRVLKLRVDTLGPDHPEVTRSIIREGEIAQTASQSSRRFRKAEGEPYSRAVGFYERALDIYAKTHAPDDARLAACLGNLAVAYFDQGRWDKANATMVRAMQISERVLPPDSLELARRFDEAAHIRSHAVPGGQGVLEATGLSARAVAIRAKAEHTTGRAPSLAERLGLKR